MYIFSRESIFQAVAYKLPSLPVQLFLLAGFKEGTQTYTQQNDFI
jgi:hypothetical protein